MPSESSPIREHSIYINQRYDRAERLLFGSLKLFEPVGYMFDQKLASAMIRKVCHSSKRTESQSRDYTSEFNICLKSLSRLGISNHDLETSMLRILKPQYVSNNTNPFINATFNHQYAYPGDDMTSPNFIELNPINMEMNSKKFSNLCFRFGVSTAHRVALRQIYTHSVIGHEMGHALFHTLERLGSVQMNKARRNIFQWNAPNTTIQNLSKEIMDRYPIVDAQYSLLHDDCANPYSLDSCATERVATGVELAIIDDGLQSIGLPSTMIKPIVVDIQKSKYAEVQNMSNFSKRCLQLKNLNIDTLLSYTPQLYELATRIHGNQVDFPHLYLGQVGFSFPLKKEELTAYFSSHAPLYASAQPYDPPELE